MDEIRHRVALLRGVNVGGRHKVPMAELRSHLEEAGYRDVVTLLQSGNVVVGAPATTGDADLEAELSATLETRFGFAVAVMVRTGAQLAALERRNPYLEEAEADPTKVHVLFLAAAPATDAVSALEVTGPESATVDGTEVFVHYPDGSGRSKLRLDLGVAATSRNWRTVCRLVDLVGAGSGA